MAKSQKKYISEFKEERDASGLIVRKMKPKVVMVKD